MQDNKVTFKDYPVVGEDFDLVSIDLMLVDAEEQLYTPMIDISSLRTMRLLPDIPRILVSLELAWQILYRRLPICLPQDSSDCILSRQSVTYMILR